MENRIWYETDEGIRVMEYNGTQRVSGDIDIAVTNRHGYIKTWEKHKVAESPYGDPMEWVYTLFGILGLFYSKEEMDEILFYIGEPGAKERYATYLAEHPEEKKVSIFDLGGTWMKF